MFCILSASSSIRQDQAQTQGHNRTGSCDNNPSLNGFDPETVMVIQVIIIGLIMTNWMVKVKDEAWSRDLYSALVDDFLYAYDVSAFFDLELYGMKVNGMSVSTSAQIMACCWRHQAFTWTNVDLSSGRSSAIHLSAILQEMPQPSVTEISLRTTYLKFCSNLPGTNEFIHLSLGNVAGILKFKFSNSLYRKV